MLLIHWQVQCCFAAMITQYFWEHILKRHPAYTWWRRRPDKYLPFQTKANIIQLYRRVEKGLNITSHNSREGMKRPFFFLSIRIFRIKFTDYHFFPPLNNDVCIIEMSERQEPTHSGSNSTKNNIAPQNINTMHNISVFWNANRRY